MLKVRTLLAVLSFAALISGCGKKVEAVCEAKCTVAADAQACVSKNAAAEATAEERGCESEFEDWVACADARGICMGANLAAPTGCTAEIAALATCLQ